MTADWDREADVVVLGTGAGGLLAALSAHEAGASVCVLEKADLIGGTTAVSGGVIWFPNNHRELEAGTRIMSGSFTKQFPIAQGDLIEARFEPFGTVSAEFV